MSDEQFDVQRLFHEALSRASDEERARFLVEACAGDPQLRERVEVLLRAHSEAGGFLGGKSASSAASGPFHEAAADSPPSETAGTVIGSYKLIEQIGEGGMGEVWMAQQTEPVKRLVAIKFIRAGMDSRQVIARFDAERQALALMDHPNIARVLDAGTTGEIRNAEFGMRNNDQAEPAIPNSEFRIPNLSTGRPYFVMDLVKGVPITRYCDEHHLTPRQRLELFIPVCQAIQHAHQKGIIHRDLKPANVLVALYDGKPVPKVIDFGVAKAAGQSLTEKTLVTGYGALVGTLEYMSPEQAEVNQLDIDTRSDIYSLGVLLYELLTGTTPLDKNRFRGAAILEMLRIIKEEEPPRPSTRLSTSDELPSIAANRSLEPKRLSGLVRGELDWIVMKALEKDRNRRYETANGFAVDVQRYLADEPVLACPPSAGYRLRKFLRRHRGPVVAVAVIFVLLVGGILGTTAGLVRARAERDEKEKARQEAEDNFRKARQAVDEYFTLVSENTLLDEPALEPLRRQLLEAARRYYEGFVREQGSAALQGELVAAHFRIAFINYEIGYDEDWLTPFEQGVALLEDLVRKKPDLAALQSVAAGIYRPVGISLRIERPEEARTAAEKACAMWEELVRAHPELPGFQNDLATWYIVLGSACLLCQQPEEALRCHLRSSELREKLVAANPGVPRYRASLVSSLADAATDLARLGRPGEAEQTARRSLEFASRLVGDYPNSSAYLELLAWLYRVLGYAWQYGGRVKEAEEAQRQALAGYEKLAKALPWVPRYRTEVFDAHVGLGDLLWDGDRRAEATESYRRAAALEGTLDSGSVIAQDSLAWFLATCADAQFRDPRRAVMLANKSVERQPQNCGYRTTLGVAHYRAGDWRAAAEVLTKAAQMSDRDLGYNGFFQAMTQWQLGDREQARLSYDATAEWMRRQQPWNFELRRFRAEAEALLAGKGD
jgi:serine/threonine protein kinase/tetratricopeptide (TPR) repeat protein